jgi:processing peptidase subunit beta
MLNTVQRQAGQVLGLAARAFATAAVEVAGSPFLRYSNPFPAAIDHTPLLSSIPETQVRPGAGSCVHFQKLIR